MAKTDTFDKVRAEELYSRNITHLWQQKASILSDKVSIGDIKEGNSGSYPIVLPTEAEDYDPSNPTTRRTKTQFTSRWIFFDSKIWSDVIDWSEKLEILFDPQSAITKAGYMGMARTIDKLIIVKGLLGDAHEGKHGATTIQFPDSQKLAVTLGSKSTPVANEGLNLEKLIKAKTLISKADCDLSLPENKLYMLVSAEQIADLLRTTEVQSSDYNSIKALVNGTVTNFMGIEFVVSELTPKVDTVRKCVMWVKSAVKFAKPKEITCEIDRLPGESNNTQVMIKCKVGAAPMISEGIVLVPCEEK